MHVLRSPAGCPWDREQTHETLRLFLLEETYEALDAIDRGDLDDLAGELGDVLFQCVFHAQLAAEAGRFDLADAIDLIADKLIRRHPHVFTPAGRPLSARAHRRRVARTPAAVIDQWVQLKAREQTDRGVRPRVLAGVPRAMPALLRAHEIGTRVAAVGFDWPDAAQVVDKIDEEVRELREAIREGPARAAEEMGDVLFSIANLARKLGVEPESALRAANDKFTGRFDRVERRLEADGRSIHEASQEDMERAWQSVKARPGRVSARATPRRRGGGRTRS
jgi:MazG family protein